LKAPVHSIKIHGIKNCDTMKKAMRWLDEAGVDFTFHDYRKDGVDAAMLGGWCAQVGWEMLLNRRGTTWRKLDEADKQGIDEARAIALMCEYPAMIKRPLVELEDGSIEPGFSAARYTELFS